MPDIQALGSKFESPAPTYKAEYSIDLSVTPVLGRQTDESIEFPGLPALAGSVSSIVREKHSQKYKMKALGRRLSRQVLLLCNPEDPSSNPQHTHKSQTWLHMPVAQSLRSRGRWIPGAY